MATASTTRTPNGFLVFSGSLAALLVIATLFIVSIARGPRPGDLDQKRADARIAVRSQLEKEAGELLNGEGWVDKGKGIVRVPVASVFALTAKELSAKKPTRSQVKVEAPLPLPAADPAATEPPPPALTSSPQGADTIRFPIPEPPAAPTAAGAPALATPPPPAAPAAPASPAPAADEAARPPLINRTEPLVK